MELNELKNLIKVFVETDSSIKNVLKEINHIGRQINTSCSPEDSNYSEIVRENSVCIDEGATYCYDMAGYILEYLQSLKIAQEDSEIDAGSEKATFPISDSFLYVVKVSVINGLRECEMYQKAKEAGLEKYFAESIPIYKIDLCNFTIGIYFQQKMDFDKVKDDNYANSMNYFSDTTYRQALYRKKEDILQKLKAKGVFENVSSAIFPYGDRQRTRIYYFLLEKMGRKERKKFISFLKENHINDINGTNYYLNADTDELILFDYSGYES